MKIMLRYIKNLLGSDITIVLQFLCVIFCSICVIFFGNWLFMSYTAPKNIHYMYEGVKYHKENLEAAEPIKIEIDGNYKKRLIFGNDEFEGKIKIGEQVFVFSDYPLKFNKYKMGVLDTDTSNNYGFYGMIFISSMFKEVTIEIYEYESNSVYCANKWMISAPCKNTKEAVELSQRLIRR